MMGSSESLYKKKGYTLGREQSLSLELSICMHGSELKTDDLTLRPGSKSSRLILIFFKLIRELIQISWF